MGQRPNSLSTPGPGGFRLLKPLLFALLLASCGSNPYYDPSKPHHTPDGFRNNYSHVERTISLAWRWEQFWQNRPLASATDPPPAILKPDEEFLRTNQAERTLTWIGHSTVLLQLGGVNVLIDPFFSKRASPLSFAGLTRKVPPALRLDRLPHIDVVLISHDHYDHLDLPAVKALYGQPGGPPRFIVPLGLKAELADEDITTVVELDWRDVTDYRGLRVYLVPAQHQSGRGLWDANRTLWGGFVVEYRQFRFYFAGDTGYSRNFADIAGRFGQIDLAALPIGGYEPRWMMEAMHMNPTDAVQAHRDLHTRYSVGIHWGAFEMAGEPLEEPPRALANALAASGISPQQFFVMKPGETIRLSDATYR